ncbi:hypothetical protein B0E45_14590 [Sinorhizobium sp. A49]|nr:hypothetical protein B0E45_14590 [Sinorhizobium sp. A49]
MWDFAERLRASAKEVALNVEDRPELAGSVFCGGETSATTLNPTDLPPEKVAITIGRYAIVLGLLPDVPTLEAVRETLRRYRNQCVVARSYLSANQSLDLQLMLVGPRGSERQNAWRALALMVERDDRVARKLAWLRPEDAQLDAESYDEFVKRSFLARPWDSADDFEDVALDQLSETDVMSEGLPRSTADEWERIALDGDKTPDEIVTALVKAWERRGKA